MTTTLYDAVNAFYGGLVAGGVTDVVVSPGSRSTPLAVTARLHPDLVIRVVLDERAAAFVALGMAKALRRPVALVCTSGTAGANYYPALIEAGLTGVPLVAITADRPPELWGWDAGQTIDQVRLFGEHAKEFVHMPVGKLPPFRAERLGFRAAVEASTRPAGPVHVNWPMREPLEPTESWLNDFSPHTASVHSVGGDAESTVGFDSGTSERGLVVVGPLDATPPEIKAIDRLATDAGWPIVADPLSQLRSHRLETPILDAADHVFNAGAADAMRPEVVVRIGATPTSKAFRLWMERVQPPTVVLMDADHRWSDPSGLVTVYDDGALAGSADREWVWSHSDWSTAWVEMNSKARAVVDAAGRSGPLLELGVARVVADAAPTGSALSVASSMPVRDLDMAMPAGDRGLRVLANRGANGIDGTVATAAGVAAALGRTTLLVGDLALLHDIGGLVTAVESSADLTIVVVDNGGGGIFAMLPIADLAEQIHYTELFRTPPRTRATDVAGAMGIEIRETVDRDELATFIGASGGQVRLVVVPIDHDASHEQRQTVRSDVAKALS